ncbi:ER membrane protein complex subunit 3 [Anopheles aquasalis]|nr:ER membrane protein complex subunit 3 [Anopheles aquasalis]
MAELLIDPNIRGWVFLPIVVITFLVGIIRHYFSILITSQKKAELTQIQDSQAMIRARLLRENGKYLTQQSFAMRRHYFNNEETGYFKTQKRAPPSPNSTAMLSDLVKGNFINVLPMIVIGGWINWMFSGFVTTKVPFPLTLRFKPMLQRGIELASLDAAWVSSASWYFLNVFGLRSIYTLVLGENNAADQTQSMQDQMSGAAVAMPQDPKAAFKAEWEALQITEYQNALANIENELLAGSNGAASGDAGTGFNQVNRNEEVSGLRN